MKRCQAQTSACAPLGSTFRYMDQRSLLLVLLTTLLPSGRLLACTTDPGLTVKDYFKGADHVLLAEVVGGSRTAQSDNPADAPPVETVQFKVLVPWKGGLKVGSSLTTITSLWLGSCGLTVDSTLRVLVKTPPSTLKTGEIWVLFLGGGAPIELLYGSGSARLGDGGENLLGALYRLAPRGGKP
jgi:hypothetical protein